jgi:hypothetical protein
MSKKFGDEFKVQRFLEEEGFYVGTKPFVTRQNMNMMEHRLLKLPDKVI